MDRSIAIVLKLIDQFSGPLKTATGAISSATGSMASGVTSGIGKVMAGFGQLVEKGKWASLLVGGALLNVAKDAVMAASEFEKFNTATKFLTGSTEEAKKFALSIKDMALESVFTTQNVMDLGKRVLANTRDVDKSTVVMRANMEAVAGTGGSYSELEGVTRAWTQTNSRAKASAQEMNQFINQGIPIYKLLSESIVNNVDSPLRKYIQTSSGAGGATKAMTKEYVAASANIGILGDKLKLTQQNFDKAVSSGKIQKDAVSSQSIAIKSAQAAYDKANGSIGAYTTAQKKASGVSTKSTLTIKSVEAALSEIAELKIPGDLLASEITKIFQKGFGGANASQVNTFAGQLSQLQDRLGYVKNAFLGVDAAGQVTSGGIFSQLTGILKNINNFLESNGDAITAFGEKIGKSLPATIGILTFLFGTLAGAIWGILGPALLVGGGFALLGAGIGWVIEKMGGFQGVADKVNAAIDWMKTKVDQAKEAWEGFKDKVFTIIDEFKAKIEGAKTWLKEHEDAIKNVATVLGVIFGPAIIVATGHVAALGAKFIWNSTVAIAGFIADLVKLTFTTIANAIVALGKLTIELTLMGIKFIWNTTIAIAGFLVSLAKTTAAAWLAFASYFGVNLQLFALGLQFTASSVLAGIWSGVVGVATAATWLFNAALAVLTSPIFLIIAAIGLLIAAGIWLYNHWDEVKAKAIEIWGAIKNWLIAAWEATKKKVVEIWEKITKALSDAWEGIKTAAASAWNSIKESIIAPIKDIIEWAGRAIDKLKEMVGLKSKGDKISLGGDGGGYQTAKHGGIVNGPVGEPIPIIAHGGERVIPRSGAEAGGSGGITINFNGGVSLDSESRIQELADKIGSMLGRQNELARYGVAY